MKTKHLIIVKTAILGMLLCTPGTQLPWPACAAAPHSSSTSAHEEVYIVITPGQVRQGSVAKITVSCPASITAISYSYQNINSRLYKDKNGTYSGLLPVAAKQKPGAVPLTVILQNSTGTTITRQSSVAVIEQDFDVQHLTIEPSKATLSKADLDRHTRERTQVMDMFNQSLPERQWADAFTAPIQGRISTPFGVQRFINKEPRNPHSGVDIAASSGTPITAAAAGRVSLTGEHFFAGKSVYIDHGNQTFSMYFHMEAIAVHEGHHVKKGDTLGYVGSTGRATGPHLHWGVRIHDIPVDPFSLLALFEE